MKIGPWLAILTSLLFGAAACSSGGDNPAPSDAGGGDTGVSDTGGHEPDSGEVDAGQPDSGTPDSGEGDGGEVDGGPGEECAKPANVARRQQLVSAQPVIAVRSRSAITATVTFHSVADDPSVECPVTLQFKDSNGNGTAEPYENWTLTAQERAADLVGRMTADQRMALMAHATLTDVPGSTSQDLSAATAAMVTAGIRFGRTSANSALVNYRATWANNLQAASEAAPLGIPFVLSMEPSHSIGNGRTKAKGFSHWPSELGLAATNDLTIIEGFGRIAAADYRAIGVTMALSPSADLATEPRWYQAQFTFGEDSAKVSERVAAYIKGMQGTTLGPTGVACVVKHFPGAGPAKQGWDARLAKGKFVSYPGNNVDAHIAPFKKAIDTGVSAIMPGYGVLEAGSWSGQSGLINGSTIEQVGVSFNSLLLSDVLRTHLGFTGVVLAPWGIIEDAGLTPLGAPWGMESATKAQRAAKAVNAGVDQFGGLGDTIAIAAARTAGLIADTRIDAAAARVLAVPFALGLFENPYVDPALAAPTVGADSTYQASLRAMDASVVLVKNELKPLDWLNGNGDGSQVGDPGNAGNGSGRILPAPPGAPYIAPGCSYFIAGNFDLDYVRSVGTGYGTLTNDATEIDGVPVSTAAQRMAHSNYVIVRVSAPYTKDPDSGALNLPLPSLEYASNDVTAVADVAAARAAINALPGSKTQIVVIVDSGRPSVVSEILGYNVSGLYVAWLGVDSSVVDDKVALDVAFGIVSGMGILPVGLPLSDVAVQSPAVQKEDLAGDGQHPTFVKGFGMSTNSFF